MRRARALAAVLAIGVSRESRDGRVHAEGGDATQQALRVSCGIDEGSQQPRRGQLLGEADYGGKDVAGEEEEGAVGGGGEVGLPTWREERGVSKVRDGEMEGRKKGVGGRGVSEKGVGGRGRSEKGVEGRGSSGSSHLPRGEERMLPEQLAELIVLRITHQRLELRHVRREA